jgi:hypothetical protein
MQYGTIRNSDVFQNYLDCFVAEVSSQRHFENKFPPLNKSKFFSKLSKKELPAEPVTCEHTYFL